MISERMKKAVEAVEDYIYEIAKNNCSEDHWDEIMMMEPGMLNLNPDNIIHITKLIYEATGEVTQ